MGFAVCFWDQGEAKTRLEGVNQFTAMTALITGWREVWGQGEFPFLHVQKPSGGVAPFDPENPINRGAASFAPEYPAKRSPSLNYNLDHIKMNTIKNAPLVTAVDLGTGIHPANKSGYGARAVQVALGEVYGREIATCGPIYHSHTVDGDKIRVQFEETGEGLTFRHADDLRGFEVSGSDGVWHWAEAKIEIPDTVIVNSPQVAAPVNVRYAFERAPNYSNLYNLDGLPGLMFTTEE